MIRSVRDTTRVMKVLGIDPGTHKVGYGLLSEEKSSIRAIDYGVIAAPSGLPLSERLGIIYRKLDEIIRGCRPDAMSVEKIFFGINSKSTISLGEARGVVLVLADLHGVPIQEYSATQIKQAVTGQGRAHKDQIGKMMRYLLKLSDKPCPEDAADALASAYCALNSTRAKRIMVTT